MAKAAAIDRIVHHSVILEFDVASYRTEAAKQRTQQGPGGSAAARPMSRPEEPVGTKSQDDRSIVQEPEKKVRAERKRQK
jgi:hypothetical protein